MASHPNVRESGHAIQIIGYDTETLVSGEEIPYWVIENSWGADGHMDLFGGEPQDPFQMTIRQITRTTAVFLHTADSPT